MKNFLFFLLLISSALLISCSDSDEKSSDSDSGSNPDIVPNDSDISESGDVTNEGDVQQDESEISESKNDEIHDEDFGSEKSDSDAAEIVCETISIDKIGPDQQYPGFLIAKLQDILGETAKDDRFEIQFYEEQSIGTYGLGNGDNSNMESCKQCVIVREDIDQQKK